MGVAEDGNCNRYYYDHWKIQALNLVPFTLSSASCLHVTLLVLLRLLAVAKPLKYKDIDKQPSHAPIFIIWLLASCVCLIPVFTERFVQGSCLIVHLNRILVLHGLQTIPIICTVLLYIGLIRTIRKTRHGGVLSISERRCSTVMNDVLNKQMKMITGIVISLIVCYLPYLLWLEYCNSMFPYMYTQLKTSKTHKIEVIFSYILQNQIFYTL